MKLFIVAVLTVSVIGCSARSYRTKETQKSKRLVSDVVAFSSQLTDALPLNIFDLLKPLSLNSVLNQITTNIGGVIDDATGQLTIAQEGVYFITATVSSVTGLGMDLVKNNQVVSSATNGVLSTVLDLVPGDVLSLDILKLGSLPILGNLLLKDASLTGFLL